MSNEALNPEQFRDLYHRTTPENAEEIKATGRWTSHHPVFDSQGKMAGTQSYFSSHLQGHAEGYGSAVVKVHVPSSMTTLEDEFPSGEQHFTINNARLNKAHVVG